MVNIMVGDITTLKQLQQLDGLDIAFAGLVFDATSPAYSGDKLKAKELIAADLDISTVGIFCNATYEEIMAVAEKYELSTVQLNGDESPDLCADLSDDLEVIKTFRIGVNTESLDNKIKDYDDVCDYYLFDTIAGGTKDGGEKKLDWKKITGRKIEKPFFLGGSIGPDDAAAIKKFRHPDFFGVYINTLFETEPGMKDMKLVLKFLHGLK